uniref:Uncharacterized protein n=1 Tax=Cacopsylla melanoneura TaxID=428564 RepID=A0A8D9E4D9_9HEMI
MMGSFGCHSKTLPNTSLILTWSMSVQTTGWQNLLYNQNNPGEQCWLGGDGGRDIMQAGDLTLWRQRPSIPSSTFRFLAHRITSAMSLCPLRNITRLRLTTKRNAICLPSDLPSTRFRRR